MICEISSMFSGGVISMPACGASLLAQAEPAFEAAIDTFSAAVLAMPVAIGVATSLGARMWCDPDSLTGQALEEAEHQVVLDLDNVFDAVCKKPGNGAGVNAAPMTLWHCAQYILLNVREAGRDWGINTQGFGVDEALVFLKAVRARAAVENYLPEQVAERLLTHEFSDQMFSSLAQLWQMAGRHKYFDRDHSRQRQAFSVILARALSQASELRERRLTQLVSRYDRLPYRRDHLVSPVPLTEDLAGSASAENYFFLEGQVQIPGVSEAFESVRPLPTGTGFVVSRDGHIITCSHCVAGVDLGKWGTKVRVLHFRENTRQTDLALLQIPALSDRRPVTFPDPADDVPDVGFSIGYPGIFRDEREDVMVVSMGRVLRDGSNGLLVGAESMPGSSGSPVVDAKGRLLGMVIASERGYSLFSGSFAEGVRFVPVKDIQRLLRKFDLI